MSTQSVSPNGSLFLLGGGMSTPILKQFVELAGGSDANLVVVPTALDDHLILNDWKEFQPFEEAGPIELHPQEDGFVSQWPLLGWLKWVGATNVSLLHTRDRKLADTDAFVQPIREASGVFFSGGNAEFITNTYRDTLTHQTLHDLLARGGAIGGMSAGAKIQGSYMDSGAGVAHAEGEPGLGFVQNLVALPHCLIWNRQFELIPIVSKNPELLGIGLDEDNGVIIRGDILEVIGESYTAIYDHSSSVQTNYDHEMRHLSEAKFFFLAPGDRYNIQTRHIIGNSKTYTDPVSETAWSEL